MKLYISFDNNPEYIRPLAIRLASDDHTIDKFAGIQDYSDTEQLKTLFKSWLKCVEEINRQEQTVPTLKTVMNDKSYKLPEQEICKIKASQTRGGAT